MIKTGLIWSGAALAIMYGTVWWAHGALPDGDIPIHWNANGEADRLATRDEALFALGILPGAALFTSLLLALAPSIDPFRENLRKSRKAYLAIWAGVMILMAALTAGIAVMMSRGSEGGSSNEFVRFVMAGCGLLFMLIGNYLPKTRKTFFLGIRTPWTLTSDYVWEKTHRLAGRLLMITGMMGIASAFIFDGVMMIMAFIVPVIASKLFCVGYSWWVWRRASDRNEGADYVV